MIKKTTNRSKQSAEDEEKTFFDLMFVKKKQTKKNAL